MTSRRKRLEGEQTEIKKEGRTRWKQKVSGMGVNSLWKYAALGVAYALFHSFMEEYYWRWFVFGQLERLVSTPTAIAVSALGFMAHHVIVLATYFGWAAPATWIFSLCVAVGGAVWAWAYHRGGSLLSPWISHGFVDAAIFLIGYDLANSSFGA
jgi:membrane protease YdiL (CAAX protease family)